MSYEQFRADVVMGLRAARKSVPCRWLYDSRGSALFERITALPEYEVTRLEAAILAAASGALRVFARETSVLIEYGAGSARKTEGVIRSLPDLEQYVPLDVADSTFGALTDRYRALFPELTVTPVLLDFTGDVELACVACVARPGRRLAMMLGSTIGNLDARATIAFLGRMRRDVGRGGRAIVGVDTTRDPSVLVPAYDDAQGVTALFNLNLLHRINRELDGGFVPESFRHRALWSARDSAMEMHLESRVAQVVRVGQESFGFAEGETIHTETSFKYDVPSFSALAERAGWSIARTWSDARERFTVFGLES